MTDQHLADLLLSQWNLLWPLNPLARRQLIQEVAADYEFEIQLHAVAFEMSEVA